eukprot:13873585-Alexandrium_andersonii.AAC.1
MYMRRRPWLGPAPSERRPDGGGLAAVLLRGSAPARQRTRGALRARPREGWARVRWPGAGCNWGRAAGAA